MTDDIYENAKKHQFTEIYKVESSEEFGAALLGCDFPSPVRIWRHSWGPWHPSIKPIGKDVIDFYGVEQLWKHTQGWPEKGTVIHGKESCNKKEEGCKGRK